MILNGLKAARFMRFQSFELASIPESGLIGIFGDNECGKSTIGEMISFALFGRTPKSPDGQPDNLIKWGGDSTEVEVVFTLGERRYRVLRALHRDGTHEVTLVDDITGAILAPDQAAADTLIPDILNYGFREFRYSTHIAQKELDIILHSAEDRKVVLNNMLGVGFMERMSRKVGAKRVEREAALKVRNRRIADKTDVLNVYLSRQEDMRRLEERIDAVNHQLLNAIRERDQISSTLSLLSEIKQKRQKYDGVDTRIKTRREILKQIESQAADLIRETDSIPRLDAECRQKEDLIEEIRAVRMSQIRDDLLRVDHHREMKRKLEERILDLQQKGKSFAENTEKLDGLKTLDIERNRALAEHTILSGFIDQFSGDMNFGELIRGMLKDLELVRSDIDRAGLSHRSGYDVFLEREKNINGQLERLMQQLESSDTPQVDNDVILSSPQKELHEMRRRDLSFAGGGGLILIGVVLTFALSNPLLLLVALGSLPAGGLGMLFQGRLAELRRKALVAQQQSYAYSIAQRGLNDIQEGVDECRAKLETLDREKERHAVVHKSLSALRTGSFDDLDAILSRTEGDEVLQLLEPARLRILEMMKAYSPLRSVMDPATSFEQMAKFDVDAFMAAKEKQKAELEETMMRIDEQLEHRKALSAAHEILLRELELFQSQVENMRREINDSRITEADEPRLQNALRDADLQMEQLRRDIEQNRGEIARIRSQADQAGELDARRSALIKELDEDMILFYELREGTRDIDVSEERFAELTGKLITLEREVTDLSGVISKLDGEAKIINEDLHRVARVKQELSDLRAEMRADEMEILKFRELEHMYISTGLSIKKRLIPQIEAYFAYILPKMTRDRYHRVKLGDDFEISVFSQEKDGFVPLSVLSGGTVDQLLISLRLAFSRAATAGTHMSQYLFLDEPFSSFDESRRRLFFDLLLLLKSTFQQIFIISHLPNLEEFTDHYVRVTLNDKKQPKLTSWK